MICNFFYIFSLLLCIFSNLLEKTSDAVIKAAKNGDFLMVCIIDLSMISIQLIQLKRFDLISAIILNLQLRDLHMQGYSLLSIDASGQTALHYACKYGHKDIVKYLISYAPNSIINMVDNTT